MLIYTNLYCDFNFYNLHYINIFIIFLEFLIKYTKIVFIKIILLYLLKTLISKYSSNSTMASLCKCGLTNCDTDDGVTVCPSFMRKQQQLHAEYLQHAQANVQAQQAYFLLQAQAQLAQVQAQAQANAQLAHAQQHFSVYQAQVEKEKVARTMIELSGVNQVACHLCDKKNCNGLGGLKTHLRCHFEPFRCSVCNWAIKNNNSATLHFRTCPVDTLFARTHFQEEESRLISDHKLAKPNPWNTLPHASF